MATIDNDNEVGRLHRVLQGGFRCLGPFASNSAEKEVGRFGAPGAQPGTKTEMLFALQTAWTFIHGSKDEQLKKEASELLHNNSEWKGFWDEIDSKISQKPKSSPSMGM